MVNNSVYTGWTEPRLLARCDSCGPWPYTAVNSSKSNLKSILLKLYCKFVLSHTFTYDIHELYFHLIVDLPVLSDEVGSRFPSCHLFQRFPNVFASSTHKLALWKPSYSMYSGSAWREERHFTQRKRNKPSSYKTSVLKLLLTLCQRDLIHFEAAVCGFRVGSDSRRSDISPRQCVSVGPQDTSGLMCVCKRQQN